MADDDKAQTSLIFDASGAKQGAAEFKAAADQVVAADAAVGQAGDKVAETVTKAEGKKTSARKAAAQAAADASRAQIAAAAAAGDATVAATDRAVTSYSRQTRFLDQLARSFDPLGAAANTAASKLQALLDIVGKGGPNAERAAGMVDKAAERLVAAQQAMSGFGGRGTAEFARLQAIFDPLTVSAQRMTAELRELNVAQRDGVNIAGGYANAWQNIVDKYDLGIQAAKRAAAEQRALIEQARATQNAENAQGGFNQVLGVKDQGQRKSARESASVFQEKFEADDKLLAERKALEAEFNPLKTATDAYAASLARLNLSVKTGVIDEAQAVVQRQRMAQGFERTKKAIEDYGHANGQAAFAQRQFSVQMVQLFSSIQGGQPILLALIQQGHQIIDVALATGTGFGVLGQAIKTGFGYLVTPIGLMVAAAAGLAALGIAAEVSTRRLATMRNQLGGVRDDAAGSVQMAEAAARHLAATTSLGTNEARSAGGTLLGAREFQGDQAQLEALIVAAQKLSLRLGEDLPASAERLKKGLQDPVALAKELADRGLKGLDQALVNAATRLQEAGKKAEAFDLVFHALQANVNGVKTSLSPLDEALQKLGQSFTSSWQGGKSFADVLGTAVTGAAAGAILKITELVETIKAAITWIDQHTPEWLKKTVNYGAGSPLGPLGMLLPSTQPDTTGAGQIKDPAVAEAVRSSSAKAGLDPNFVARLQRSEGVQNPDGTWQTSPTGALGPMQVLPSTYQGMAKQPQNFPGIEGLDVNKAGDNVQIGTMLLKHLIQRYDGDLKTAVLAYHDGETVTNRALRGEKDPRTGLPQMFSQDALDQARKVMSGYSGTGLATSTPGRTPGEGALTGRGAATPSAAGVTPSGAANVNVVNDAVELATGMNLVSPAAAKALGAVEILRLGLAKLKEENKQGTPQFALLTEGMRRARLQVQETIEPADQLTQSLDRQTAGENRIALAYGKGYSEVARATAAVRAEEEARTRAAVGTVEYTELKAKLTAQYLAQADAQQKTALGQEVQGIDMQVKAQNNLREAYAQGEVAVVRATAASRAESKARELAQAGLADYKTARATLTEGYIAEANAASQAAISQQMLANDNQMTYLTAEAAALGMTNEQRTIYLASLGAELDLKARGLPLNDAVARSYITQAANIADAKRQIDQTKQAAQELENIASGAMDKLMTGLTTPLRAGETAAQRFLGTITSVIDDVMKEFMKLAVLNPLLNELFPGKHRSTLSDLGGGSGSGADGSGGIFGSGLLKQAGGMLGQWFSGGSGLDMSAGASGAAGIAEAASAASGMGSGASFGGNFSLAAAHSGGLIGETPSLYRAVDPGVFFNAPRFHGGLGANEFATILERGERVLTQPQQRAMVAAANGPANDRGHTFNITVGGTMDRDAARRTGDQIAVAAADRMSRSTARARMK